MRPALAISDEEVSSVAFTAVKYLNCHALTFTPALISATQKQIYNPDKERRLCAAAAALSCQRADNV